MAIPEDGTQANAPCDCLTDISTVTVNRVHVAAISPEEALETVAKMQACPATHLVNHVPADVTVRARRDPKFKDAVNRASINVADGMGVVLACRALGCHHMRERVYGPDFMGSVSNWGLPHNIRHFLLGGSDEVRLELENRLRQNHMGILIAGSYSPPFGPISEIDIGDIAARINEESPHIVWVGLGTPKQQIVGAALAELVDTRAIITVGAAFDFLAGAKRQAPKWMQHNGLEWTFRLATEPRRLAGRYLLGNPLFIVGFTLDAVRNRTYQRRQKAMRDTNNWIEGR